MTTKDIKQKPQYYDRYVGYVPDNMSINSALSLYGPETYFQEYNNLAALGDLIYAPGKWTINQMMQHIIDTERIFAYRALRFARRDRSVLPGFDEDEYARIALASHRSLNELIAEWESVRESNKNMFQSFSDDDLHSEGQIHTINVSTLAMGFIIVGHALHHLTIIKERYYPLLSPNN